MSLETITTISPSTNKPILKRNGLSPNDVTTLCENATNAFNSFKNTTLNERQKIVIKALELLGANKDILAKELTEQMGRPIAYTAKEITTAVARAEYLLKISDEVLADTPGEAERGFKRLVRKTPVGPTLIIFAWNVSPSTFLHTTSLTI
jgi:acyl-CoA reductase-like NAD-dependent aldehyde dehydrogenase